LRDSGLAFHPLFIAEPHIFVSRRNPLATKARATLADLAGLPRLTFDQGANNSFYFAEEILSTRSSAQEIRVSDRATIFNLMIGLDGYTISTGIISDQLDPEIVAVPLDVDERIEIGWIGHAAIPLTEQAQRYLAEVRAVVADFGVTLLE
ncbi:MAG: LysR family transcriptional regulator, partial [Microbacterium sp.]